MSLKYTFLLLGSLIATNNIYALDYYMNNLENLPNNNQFMQNNYLTTQNEMIHKKIAEKLEHARQQLEANPDDNELSAYIKKLEDLQQMPNVSQEADMDTLISLQLVDINTNEVQNNAQQNNQEANSGNNEDDQNNSEVNQNNSEVNQNSNIENQNNLQDDNNIGNNNQMMIEPMQINSDLFDNNLSNQVNFQQLLDNIKNNTNEAANNNTIKEFCDKILANEDYLDDILTVSEIDELQAMREIIARDIFSSYMKKDIDTKLTILLNTFIGHCQAELYGNLENQELFNTVFDEFFKQSKENQYIKKINDINQILNNANNAEYADHKKELIKQIIQLLMNNIKQVEKHINNAFSALDSKKQDCYNKVCNKNNNSTIEINTKEPNTNYTLMQLMDSIYGMNNNFYDANSNCNKLKYYLFNDYNATHFKITIQEDISSLKFKLKKNIELNETEKGLQNILNNAQDNQLTANDYDSIYNKYTTNITEELKNAYDNAHKRYLNSCTKFVNKFWLDVDNIKKYNLLNTINDQLKLDISEKLIGNNYFTDKADTYMFTIKLYPDIN